MKYDCTIRHWVKSAPTPYIVTVEADHAGDAARAAARVIAARLFKNGEPGFVSQDYDSGTYLACIGEPLQRDGRLITEGFTIAISVQALEDANAEVA